MAEFTLYLGNKATSSWSMRGWLACKLAGIQFDEVVHNMEAPDWKDFVARISPTAKVPVLVHGQVKVWESIAIAEYLADLYPRAGMWPEDRVARAQARAIAAEMHAGYMELRRAMFMNFKRSFPGRGRTPGALADIARIAALWRETRARFAGGGKFLFGDTANMADAMFFPVVSRFMTWTPELPADTQAYVSAVWSHPLMVEWREAADSEPWIMQKYETPLD
jgi:glutathione S-transferase